MMFVENSVGDAPAVPRGLRERQVRAHPAAGASEQGARALAGLVPAARHAAQDVPAG